MKTALEILNVVLEKFSDLEKTDNGYAIPFYRDRSDNPFDADSVQAALENGKNYGGAADAFQIEILDEAWDDTNTYFNLKAAFEHAVGEAVMNGEMVGLDGFDLSDWYGRNAYKQTFPDEWKNDRYVAVIDTGMTVGDFHDCYPFADFSELDEQELDDSDDLTFKVRLTLENLWKLYDGRDNETGTVQACTVDVDGYGECEPMGEDGVTFDIADIKEITLEADSRYITEGAVNT